MSREQAVHLIARKHYHQPHPQYPGTWIGAGGYWDTIDQQRIYDPHMRDGHVTPHLTCVTCKICLKMIKKTPALTANWPVEGQVS